MGILEDLILGAKDLVDDLANDVNDALDDAADWIKQLAKSVWQVFLDLKYTFIYYFEKAMDLVKNIATTLKTEIIDKISGVVNYINEKINGVRDIITNSIVSLRSRIDKAISTVKTFINNKIADINNAINIFKAAIDRRFNDVYKTLSQFADILFDPDSYFELFESVIDAVW